MRASGGAVKVEALLPGSGNRVLAIHAKSHPLTMLTLFPQFMRRLGTSAGSASLAVAESVTDAPASANTSLPTVRVGNLFTGSSLPSFGLVMTFAKFNRPPVEVLLARASLMAS